MGSSGCAGERLGAPLEEVAGGLGPRLRAAAWGPAQVTSVLESARGARHCNIQSWHLRGMLSLPLKVGVEYRVLFWGPRASPNTDSCFLVLRGELCGREHHVHPLLC